MTDQQKEGLNRIGKELKLLFPSMYGNISFNMKPERKDVAVKIINDICFKDLKR